MPGGLRALRQIFFGRENQLARDDQNARAITSVFVTGRLGMRMNQELYMPDDLETGRLASFERSIPVAREAALPFEADANYEQLAYFLGMAITGGENVEVIGTKSIASFTVGTGAGAGSGYTSPPEVRISGGGGSGANARAVISSITGSAVTGVTVDAGGSGYISVPTVSFSGGGGTGATATVTLGSGASAQVVTAVNIGAGGSGYTSAPTVSFSGGGGSGATATATVTVSGGTVTSIILLDGGVGYGSGVMVSLIGGGGTGATATAALATGTSSYRWTYNPNYYESNTPDSYTVEYGDNVQQYRTTYVSCRQLELSGQVGDVVQVRADLYGQDMKNITKNAIVRTEITDSGSGYTGTPPTVTVTKNSSQTTEPTDEAKIVPIVSRAGLVTGLNIIRSGAGYVGDPNIAIAGSGTGATAKAYLGDFTGVDPDDNDIEVEQNIEPIRMGTARFYFNDAYDGLEDSGSRVNGTLVDFGWRLATGFNPMKYANNQLTFTDITEAKRHVELDMTVALNPGQGDDITHEAVRSVGTRDWYEMFRNQTKFWLGLFFAGTNRKGLWLKMGGKFTEFSEMSEREGQNIVKVKFVSEFDENAGDGGDGFPGKDMEVKLYSPYNDTLNDPGFLLGYEARND